MEGGHRQAASWHSIVAHLRRLEMEGVGSQVHSSVCSLGKSPGLGAKKVQVATSDEWVCEGPSGRGPLGCPAQLSSKFLLCP